MPDENAETMKTDEMKLPGLEADASALQRLGKLLVAAAKSRAFGRADFSKQIEEASKLAGQINWTEVKANIEKEASVMRAKDEANLSGRREKLHQAASAAQCPAAMGTHFDRIDIFQVEYEGVTAVVRLGGVVLERVKEGDGEKLFSRLQQLRTTLDQTPFDRDQFFKMLKGAYAICRRAVAGGDEFVPVRDLHREMVLERARNSERFRKSAEPKNIDPYALPQFVFDLARLLRGGVSVGGERIVTQTPSMRESRETVHIPNLDHPASNEVAAARLAVRPVSP
jgi:hypothetical protein